MLLVFFEWICCLLIIVWVLVFDCLCFNLLFWLMCGCVGGIVFDWFCFLRIIFFLNGICFLLMWYFEMLFGVFWFLVDFKIFLLILLIFVFVLLIDLFVFFFWFVCFWMVFFYFFYVYCYNLFCCLSCLIVFFFFWVFRLDYYNYCIVFYY